MKCPYCHETENRVIDSRLSKDNNMIRRRRECGRCNRRFTTYERVEEMMPLVVKKDGRRESYDRLKIINGLRRACHLLGHTGPPRVIRRSRLLFPARPS